MPTPSPAWASELVLAYESRASNQFILFGNVHDRVAVNDRLVGVSLYNTAYYTFFSVPLRLALALAVAILLNAAVRGLALTSLPSIHRSAATQPGSRVTLHGEPVDLRPDGTFTVRYSLPNCRQVIPAVACSRDGVEQRTIVLAVERNTKAMEPVTRDIHEL